MGCDSGIGDWRLQKCGGNAGKWPERQGGEGRLDCSRRHLNPPFCVFVAQTGEQQRIRALFERATHLPLPPKKMKFLFRRYLEYEKSEGDAAAVEHVKRRAMEFVEQSLKA